MYLINVSYCNVLSLIKAQHFSDHFKYFEIEIHLVLRFEKLPGRYSDHGFWFFKESDETSRNLEVQCSFPQKMKVFRIILRDCYKH